MKEFREKKNYYNPTNADLQFKKYKSDNESENTECRSNRTISTYFR